MGVDYIVSPSPEHNYCSCGSYGVSEGLLQLLLSKVYLMESCRALWFGSSQASCSVFVVLQATVGGVEDLGMRLLLREMHASGKR